MASCSVLCLALTPLAIRSVFHIKGVGSKFMATGKTYQLRFMDKTGTYIGQVSRFTMSNFRKVINGGLGDLKITLPMPFDQAYVSPFTVIFNRVEVYVQGNLLYSGFIAGVNAIAQGRKEDVVITCRGHAARLPFIVLKNGTTITLRTDTAAGLTTGATATAATIDVLLKAVIDRYNAEAVYPIINYTATSVTPIATTFTYTFLAKTIFVVIERAMEVTPAGTYWRVGADNIFYVNTKSTTADITLNFATQVAAISDNQSIDGMINRALVAYNGTPPTLAKLTTDTTSSGLYGDWWWQRIDGKYTVAGDVTSLSQKIIDGNKNPPRRLQVVVPDSAGSKTSGYDIETIEPGQTLKLINLPEAAAQSFPSLFQIVAVDYTPEAATLDLETPTDDLARELAKKERMDAAAKADDFPATYT